MSAVIELKNHLADQLVSDVIEGYSATKLSELAAQYGTPLFVVDEDKIAAQYQALSSALPGVKMRYAIKALPDAEVLRHLHDLGCGFDIATNGEIDLLKSCHIGADQTIHTHPIKKDGDIQYALGFGCRIFVVDNMAEIDKFVDYKSQVQLLIRVNFRNQDAVVDLSRKFGCVLTHVPDLVRHAQNLGIKIAGVSFHVGSQVPSPYAHVEAIEMCAELFQSMPSVDWSILDIGGGFPIEYNGPAMDIESFCQPINEALSLMPAHMSLLAEPGRFIAGPSAIHLMSVVGKAHRGGRTWYYLDDGVYGALSGQMFDHARYPIKPLKTFDITNPVYPSVLAGPTCDSIDVIDEDKLLPELAVGDLLVASQVGAYTMASATVFNLYAKPKSLCLKAAAMK
ncbi:type III PLP-dependent enzyme [Marinicella rhabdoformis]|uniref:type III PLP-dependent enzyme n=1 Tax=Marinicella rhabdoformis TaxID=2580566 RepID=UPI0012AECD5C|nr:type III PLP-dependent enzyme [Marinicella rhabdoformis]